MQQECGINATAGEYLGYLPIDLKDIPFCDNRIRNTQKDENDGAFVFIFT